MNQLGFKRALILGMVLITAVAVGTSNYFNYRTMSSELKNRVYSETQELVTIQKQRLTDFIYSKSLTVERVADDYREYGYTDRHAERMRVAANAGDIANLTVGFTNGDAYCSFDLPGWVDNKNPPSYDPTKRPWFSQAMSASGLIYTEPYEDATTKDLMVSIGKKADNNTVILADIPLTVLKDAVAEFDIEGGIAIVMDEKGIALASTSNVVKIGDQMGSNADLRHVVEQVQNSEQAIIDYTLNGVDKVMFSERLKYGQKNWYIMVGLDKSVVFKNLYEIRSQTIIMTLVYVLVSAVVTFLILNLLYKPILALKETVLGLSSGNGDLTQRIEVKSTDDLGQISDGVNRFIGQLQKMMLQVDAVAEELEANAADLKTASDENARVLNQHVQETEQIVTAIEEMSATANTVAQNAADSSNSTQTVADISERSVSVLNDAKERVARLVSDVGDTSNSMKLMTDETTNISNILSVIGDIAAQTNLLALNAAIEAARAGEQGRGFAVVADEVRALASRTQSSTEEIEEALQRLLTGNSKVVNLMESTQQTSQETYESTGEVSDTLNELTNQVMLIKDLSIQIATAAEQQSSVTEEVNQNMSALNDIVGMLSSNSDRVVGQANAISERNSRLNSIVNQFKLK